jgi:EmrB/QacA subfamily drug resistance transporter
MTQTLPPQPGTSPSEGAAAPSPWPALSIVLAGAFMASLDGFIVLVAAPSIQADLHVTGAAIQLIVAGYGLTYAIGLITGARLGDLLGRKRMFMAGMTLFTLASLGCALAPTGSALIAGRLVQGLGSALMYPQIFAMIQVLLPPDRRRSAFSALGAVIGTSTIIGQLIGGLLIAANIFGTSWRPVFWVNIPIGIAALALAARLVPESRAPEGRRLDLAGVAVLTVALFLLVVPIVEGQQDGWPAWTWLSLASSAVAFAAFVATERFVQSRGGAPLVAMRLFRERSFSVGIALVVIAFAGVYSFFLVLSLTLQDGLGLSALQAGLVYSSLAGAFFVTSLYSGKLAARFGRRMLEAGGAISAIGFGATILVAHLTGAQLSAPVLVPSLIVVGLGNGLLLPQLLNAVLARIGPAEIGMASGVLSTGQQVGGAVGVAIIGVVFYSALGHAGHGAIGSYAHAMGTAAICNVVIGVSALLLLFALPARSGPAA